MTHISKEAMSVIKVNVNFETTYVATPTNFIPDTPISNLQKCNVITAEVLVCFTSEC